MRRESRPDDPLDLAGRNSRLRVRRVGAQEDQQVVRRPHDRGSRIETRSGCKSRRPWKLAASLAALALVASACALFREDPNLKYIDPADAEKPRHFMVLPLNLAIEAPADLEPALHDMFGAIAGYIRGRGDSIETLSRDDASAQWAAAIQKVTASEALENNFASAMRVFVANLAETHTFNAVIAPSLVYRTTKTRERTAKWDGVFRKMKVINLSDTAKKKGLARSFTVEISGVSLHVMIFEPGGTLIFQKYGGLDLAHNVDMANAEFTLSPSLALREDLLKDGEHIGEGIGKAFDPYLPR
jgi:hypothetical protein